METVIGLIIQILMEIIFIVSGIVAAYTLTNGSIAASIFIGILSVKIISINNFVLFARSAILAFHKKVESGISSAKKGDFND